MRREGITIGIQMILDACSDESKEKGQWPTT